MSPGVASPHNVGRMGKSSSGSRIRCFPSDDPRRRTVGAAPATPLRVPRTMPRGGEPLCPARRRQQRFARLSAGQHQRLRAASGNSGDAIPVIMAACVTSACGRPLFASQAARRRPPHARKPKRGRTSFDHPQPRPPSYPPCLWASSGPYDPMGPWSVGQAASSSRLQRRETAQRTLTIVRKSADNSAHYENIPHRADRLAVPYDPHQGFDPVAGQRRAGLAPAGNCPKDWLRRWDSPQGAKRVGRLRHPDRSPRWEPDYLSGRSTMPLLR